MVKPERNEHRGASPAAALRLLVSNLTSNPLLKMTPGGPALVATLATLLEWVESIEARWSELVTHQSRTAAEVAALRAQLDAFARSTTLPANLRAQLYGLLSVAAAEGQLEVPVPDGARPGGARAGDIVRPGPRRFDPCECELAGPVNPACPYHGGGRSGE